MNDWRNEWQAELTGPVPQWKDKFAIVGIGETEYGYDVGISATGLTLEACKKSVDDAGLSVKDIDCLIEGPGGGGTSSEEFQVAFGLDHLNFFGRCVGGGTGPTHGLQTAMAALDAGLINYAIVTRGLKRFSERRISAPGVGAGPGATTPLQGGDFTYMMNNWSATYGMNGPGSWFSFVCRRYMHHYGLKSRHLGAIASTQRSHAMLNNNAMLRTPLSIEDYMNAPILVDPFRRWDFSLNSDGAAAIIVTTAERAKALKQSPIYIMGIGVAHPSHPNNIFTRRELPWGHKWAAPTAYQMAGVTPEDIDFAEIYDGFTFVVVIQIPSLGFASPEDAGPFCEREENNIQLGGKIPVNTHGGLCSQAHITGINHFCEAVKQLRGQAGDAQVKKKDKIAEIGLVTGAGDLGDGSVTILRR